MYTQNGPPLSVGQQLRGRKQSKVLCVIYVLYRCDLVALPISRGQSVSHLHSNRVAGLHGVLAASDRRSAPVSHFRGAAFRHIHGGHVGHAGAGDLERRDWHRAIEEGGGEMGEEVEVEKYTGSFRTIFHRMVLAVRRTNS